MEQIMLKRFVEPRLFSYDGCSLR